MNWITNFVRPKLQAFVGKKEVPDNLWETCPKCSQMLLKRELENNFFVCKHCDYHFRVSAKQRLNFFLGNNFMIMDTPKVKPDPLKFKDNKKYSDRLKEAQKNSTYDSVIVASGTIEKKKKLQLLFLILILWVVLWEWLLERQLLQLVIMRKIIIYPLLFLVHQAGQECKKEFFR